MFYVSVVSHREIAIKHCLGKFRLSVALSRLLEIVEASGAMLMPITAPHGLANVWREPARATRSIAFCWRSL